MYPAAKVAMRQSTASRFEGGDPYPSPLHSPAAFSLALRYQKDMHILEQVQHMTTNITTSPGEFIMWGETERTGTAQPGEERARGRVLSLSMTVTDFPHRCSVKGEATMGISWIKKKKQNLEIWGLTLLKYKQKFLYCKDCQLHRGPVESPCLEILKT